MARPILSPYSGLIGEFYMALRKNFTKILTYRRGGRLSPMPRRWRLGSCLDWLRTFKRSKFVQDLNFCKVRIFLGLATLRVK